MRARAALVTVVLTLVSCGVGKPPASQTAIAPLPPLPVASVPAVPPPRDDGRLPPLARPTGYRLELTVDPTQRTFSGRATIALAVPQETRVVVMHGRSLRVREATFTAPGAAHPATATARASAHGKGEADELVFTTAEPIAAGEATLTVDYDADFSEGLNGLYRVDNGGRAYAFTQFEPVGARLAFPCFDEPDAKVPFDVAVTAPSGLVVLSNMPAHAEVKSADGAHVTTTFERSPPLPTYLVALAVGPLELVERKGAPVPLRLAAAPGRASLGTLALDDASAHLAVLESYFGTKYPYPKLDLVAVPDFSSGAMENAGLVTFREERLLVDAATAPTALRRALAGTVAHELSHMWFGDLVTMRWWDDIWLNEGFATWMATRVLDTWKPEMRAGVEALGSTADAMRADTLATARRVRQPVRSTTEALEAFDGITYTKGAALLAMVERWLGPDVFQKGVIRYLAEHRFGSATASDLFSALAAESHVDVPAVLSTFTEQTGLPLVTIDPCTMKDGHPEVRVTQSEYRPLGATPSPAPKSWQFPVCVHTGGRNGGPPEKPSCVLVTGPEARLALPGTACPAFLHPNADQSGYYRAKVEPSSLPKLAALPIGTLTARERVGLLSDVWALVDSGELDVGAFLELARHFRGDPEPAVWDQITSALDELGNSVVTDASRPAFQAFVRTLLAPELAALGWEAKKKDGDAERLRRRVVIGALGAVGRDPGVLAMADRLANQWLSQSSSVDGDRAALAVPLAARSGDAKLFDRIVGKLASDPPPAERVIAVTALGRFTDPVLVRRALGKVVDGTVRAQDQIYVYAGLFARSEARPAAFATVAERPDEYLNRIAPFTRRRIVPFIARSCSPEETARAHALIAPRLASIEGADRGFSQAEEDGARCFVRRTHHSPLLAAYLEKGAKRAR